MIGLDERRRTLGGAGSCEISNCKVCNVLNTNARRDVYRPAAGRPGRRNAHGPDARHVLGEPTTVIIMKSSDHATPIVPCDVSPGRARIAIVA